MLPSAAGGQGAPNQGLAETTTEERAQAAPATGEQPRDVPSLEAGRPPASGFWAGMSQTAVQLRDLGIKGDVTYKNFSFFKDTPNDPRNFGNEGIIHLQWDRELTEWASFSIKGEARQDDRRFTRGVRTRVPDNLLHRRMVDLMESYLKLTLPGDTQLTMGKLIYTWGKGEFYSPTDNMSPYDYLDVIDRLKEPVYSGELSKTFDAPAGPVDLSFIFIPFFTPARDPLAQSRWTPATTFIPGVGDSVPGDVNAQQRVTPGREAKNMQYAIRARKTIGKVDVSVSYFYGFEYLPVVQKNQTGSTTTFVPVYRHMQVPGIDFETTVDKFVIKGEAAWKFGDRELKDSRFQGLIGVRYTRDDIWAQWLKKLTVDFEHNRQEFISSKNPQFIVSGSFLNGFRNSGSGGIEFEFNPDQTFNRETKFRVAGSVDWSQSANYWLQYQLTVKPVEDYTLETGFDVFAGEQTTFWGEWRNNDRFYFKMTRLF